MDREVILQLNSAALPPFLSPDSRPPPRHGMASSMILIHGVVLLRLCKYLLNNRFSRLQTDLSLHLGKLVSCLRLQPFRHGHHHIWILRRQAGYHALERCPHHEMKVSEASFSFITIGVLSIQRQAAAQSHISNLTYTLPGLSRSPLAIHCGGFPSPRWSW